MPSINDIKQPNKKSNIFIKKDFRPWTENTQSSQEEESIEKTQKSSITTSIKVSNIEDCSSLDKIWRHLYGAKKLILEQIINSIEEKNKDYCITYPLSTKQLEEITSLPVNTIRSNLQRLKKEGIIIFYERKPGIGGFARYQISFSLHKFFTEKFLTKK